MEIAPAYQLLVSRDKTMDEVEVKVELDKNYQHLLRQKGRDSQKESLEALQKRIARKIKNNIGLSMKISLMEHGTLPGSEGGKLNRIIDQRKF